MKLSLVENLPRAHRAMLAASAAIASGTSAHLVTNVEARTACLVGAIACSAYALSVMYDDAHKRLMDSTFFELIEESIGRRRAHVCVRAILSDHLATTTVTTAVAAYQLPRPIVAAGVSTLLMLFFWRASLAPFATRDWRAATIVRTTAITGLLMMTWCGTRCLARSLRVRPRTWQEAFPAVLGVLGRIVACGHQVRRRRATHVLVIVSLYTLMMALLIAVATVHATPIGMLRLTLQVLMAFIGLLIVLFDLGRRSRYRIEFVSALLGGKRWRKLCGPTNEPRQPRMRSARRAL
jgi:hypothetical protein